jgi:hypothetical protein
VANLETADVTECCQRTPSAEDRDQSPEREAHPHCPMTSRGHRGAALRFSTSALLGALLIASANLIFRKLMPKIARLDGQLPPAAVQQQITSAADRIPANEVANDSVSRPTGAAKGAKPVSVRQQGEDRLIALILLKAGQIRQTTDAIVLI